VNGNGTHGQTGYGGAPARPRALKPASRVVALRREAEVLLDELVRRVGWVKRLPSKAKLDARERPVLTLGLLAGGAILGGAVLTTLLVRRERRRTPLRRAARQARLWATLVAHPERAIESPPMHVSIGRSVLATALATLTGEGIRRVLQRLTSRR
jgi:hypothetical protein